MPVDRGPQIVHDALADLRRQVGLDDADRSRHQGDRDHAADELAQQREVDRHVVVIGLNAEEMTARSRNAGITPRPTRSGSAR
jgi:hypothetical protein